MKLVPFSEKERTNVGGQRMSAGDAGRVLAIETSARRSRLFEIANEAFRDTKNFGTHCIEG